MSNMTYKIAVCAGHGIHTAGKRTPDGVREWSFNEKVVKAFIAELKNYSGVEVRRYDDPTGKTDVPLRTRTRSANAWGADIYISFHHNAHRGMWGEHTGTETYYSKGSTKGKQLADVLQKANVKAYGLRDRGLKTANLHITRETKMPAALVEGGFMDSTIDIVKMRDNSILANAGKESAKAVAKFAKLKRKAATPKPSTPSTADFLIRVKVNGLHTYTRADWDAKKGAPIVNKGEVFTVVETLNVNGYEMYRLKSGWYITAANKYVETVGKAAAPSKPKKTIAQMAAEVLKGDHGNGHVARRKSLGISAAEYAKVRAEVNRRA